MPESTRSNPLPAGGAGSFAAGAAGAAGAMAVPAAGGLGRAATMHPASEELPSYAQLAPAAGGEAAPTSAPVEAAEASRAAPATAEAAAAQATYARSGLGPDSLPVFPEHSSALPASSFAAPVGAPGAYVQPREPSAYSAAGSQAPFAAPAAAPTTVPFASTAASVPPLVPPAPLAYVPAPLAPAAAYPAPTAAAPAYAPSAAATTSAPTAALYYPHAVAHLPPLIPPLLPPALGTAAALSGTARPTAGQNTPGGHDDAVHEGGLVAMPPIRDVPASPSPPTSIPPLVPPAHATGYVSGVATGTATSAFYPPYMASAMQAQTTATTPTAAILSSPVNVTAPPTSAASPARSAAATNVEGSVATSPAPGTTSPEAPVEESLPPYIRGPYTTSTSLPTTSKTGPAPTTEHAAGIPLVVTPPLDLGWSLPDLGFDRLALDLEMDTPAPIVSRAASPLPFPQDESEPAIRFGEEEEEGEMDDDYMNEAFEAATSFAASFAEADLARAAKDPNHTERTERWLQQQGLSREAVDQLRPLPSFAAPAKKRQQVVSENDGDELLAPGFYRPRTAPPASIAPDLLVSPAPPLPPVAPAQRDPSPARPTLPSTPVLLPPTLNARVLSLSVPHERATLLAVATSSSPGLANTSDDGEDGPPSPLETSIGFASTGLLERGRAVQVNELARAKEIESALFGKVDATPSTAGDDGAAPRAVGGVPTNEAVEVLMEERQDSKRANEDKEETVSEIGAVYANWL
ncbi:hypothetical protein Rhopal_000824-T1 [Rhodotorula paludigena]|uniref:Proteophosphoglycan ppg4 n=1 Tax=Rhodotorula paludigena TaxID=86838 RepID=A0AAV5GDC2_9BASI|nr:hypothetical protein Rhopal_000824-T1 [Rhodotorula paludigena]